jgi:uncharacterized protein involved in propanediol utilization
MRPPTFGPGAAVYAGGPWPGTMAGTGIGRCFGTFGELIQGALPPGGRDFLVTLPVSRWSVATFRPGPGDEVRVRPGDRHKSRALARRMLDSYGLDPGGELTLHSDLLVGKGMASSSADLVATARAIGDAYGFTPSPAEIEDLAREIEPTDGVMYNCAVAFYHREVRLLAELGPLPSLTIVGLDEGGIVDTIAFNRLPKKFSLDDMDEYETLLGEAGDAVKAGDTEALGRLATRSAVMNQRLRPKQLLEPALALCRSVGALGVAAAHSGTKLGVLLDRTDPDHAAKLARITEACAAVNRRITLDRTLTGALEHHDPEGEPLS